LTFFNTPGSAQFFAGGNQYTSAGSWTNTRGNIWQVSATFPPGWVYFNYSAQGGLVASEAAVAGPGNWYYNSSTGVLYVYSTGNPATAFTSPGIIGVPVTALDDMSWNPNNPAQLAVFNDYYAQIHYTISSDQGPIWIFNITDVAGVLQATSTVNAASYQRLALAPETIVSAFGMGLANQTLAAENASLPANLGNSTVSVTDVKNVSRPATLYFVSPGQINFVIPTGTAPGPAVLTVTNPDGAQSRSTVEIASVSPAFYTMNQNGSGVVAAYVQVVPPSGPQTYEPVYSCPGGGPPCTTKPIDVSNPSDHYYLVMFGTGFRGRSSLQGVSVTIGNQSVPVLYASAQGQYEGFDQITVQIPNSLAGAGVVNIVANVDGAQTNVVQIQLQ
jgi:uncharacterized protein (TIGR03437 family)